MAGLLVWQRVGIYPDEFSYRIHLGRYFQDDGVLYGLYSLCQSRVQQVPALFVLPAMAFSALDLALDPGQLRNAYLGVLAATFAAGLVALRNAPNRWGAALLAASVAGVAGSALVMVRHEAALTLHLLACLAAWLLAGRALAWRLLAGVFVILSALASLYSHPQGLLFLPLAVVVLYRLMLGSVPRWTAGAAVLVLAAIALATTLRFHQVSCPEQPKLEQFFTQMTATPDQGWQWSLAPAWQKWTNFVSPFLYRKEYAAKYLPGLADATEGALLGGAGKWAALNVLVMASLWLVALASAAALIHLVVEVLKRRRNFTVGTDAPAAGRLLPALLVLPTLALVLVDSQQNFYRSIYLNLLLSIAAALYVGSWRRLHRFTMLAGVLVLVTAVTSAVTDHRNIRPRLVTEIGPSVSVKTDWAALDRDVAILAARCGARPEEGAVVMDDASFNALKGKHHILPLTYLSRQSGIAEMPVAKAVAMSRPSYVLARCSLMKTTGIGWPAAAQQGALCCTRLGP